MSYSNNDFFGGRAPSILELMFTSPLSGPAGGGGGDATTSYRPRSPYHHNYYPSWYDGPESPTFFLFDNARDVEEAAARQHRRIEEQKSHHHRELQSRQQKKEQQSETQLGHDEHKKTLANAGADAGRRAQQQQQQRAQAAAQHLANQQHQAPSWLTPYTQHPFFNNPLIRGNSNDDLANLLSTGLGPLTLSPTSSIPYLSHSHLSSFSPRIDVHEDGKAFTLTAELPGMPREAVKVNVDDEKRMVIVEGEMRREYGSGKVGDGGAAAKEKGGDAASTTTTAAEKEGNDASKDKQQQHSARHHITERLYGHFSRSLYLPESAELDHVSASFKDGLLRVVVPKKQKKEGNGEKEVEEVKKRKVTVEEVME